MNIIIENKGRVMTSYVTDGTVGPWAREKLECLGKYLQAYTTILKEQSWCKGYLYIDAFAGAGKAPERQYGNPPNENDSLFSEITDYVTEQGEENETYIHGSPRIALDIKFPFTEYIFIESDRKRLDELHKLQQEYGQSRNITILDGDANKIIQNIILHNNGYDWQKYRAVTFLDPFGMQVPWNTIESLGKTKAIEVFLNLPVGMAIQRLLPRTGEFTSSKKQKLTKYFGSTEWEQIVYEINPDMFGHKVTKNPDTGERLAKWYQQRLKKAFGFSPKPRLIKNTRGTHLYYLIWAGPKKSGENIAKDVLNQGQKVK